MSDDPNRAPVAPSRDALRLAVECARLADHYKGRDVAVLEMAPLLAITDYFVLVTGDNRRQIRALSEEILVRMKRRGIHRTNLDGLDSAVWVLTDFGDVVVHIFNQDARDFYDLGGLWADAVRVDWQDEDGFENGAETPAG